MPHSVNYRIASHDAEFNVDSGAVTESSRLVDNVIQPQKSTPIEAAAHTASRATELSDAELVKAACVNDRSAFATLYRRYARTVHGVLLSRVRADDADDLVHEVFIKAMRRLHRLNDAQAFAAWICTIARNVATDHLRSRRPHASLPEIARNHADARNAAEEMLEVIRTLPDAYREPLILRLVEHMPGPEIALRTGMTEGSVRVNLHRGMKLLREKLDHGGEQ